MTEKKEQRVVLTDGTRVELSVVRHTMSEVRLLWKINRKVGCELVRLARDPLHPLSGESQRVFIERGLLQENGTLYFPVGRIVRCAFYGNELRNPVARVEE